MNTGQVLTEYMIAVFLVLSASLTFLTLFGGGLEDVFDKREEVSTFFILGR